MLKNNRLIKTESLGRGSGWLYYFKSCPGGSTVHLGLSILPKSMAWKLQRLRITTDGCLSLWKLSNSPHSRFGIELGFQGDLSSKEPICQCRRRRRQEFETWVGKIPWRKARDPRIHAWRIPRTEEPGGLQATGLQRAVIQLKWLSMHITIMT